MRAQLWLGDCLDRMVGMLDASVEVVLCDPPYGLEFMGKGWDRLDWSDGGGMARVGLGGRNIPWPSYSGTGAAGTANATCATCGGRMRGARTCTCEEPDWRVKGQPLEERAGARRMQAQQEWHQVWLIEVHRILVPGGRLKVFGGTRVYHRLAAAMEVAGFEGVGFDGWTYGSGFPKSLDVGKAVDKQAGSDSATHRAVQDYLREARETLGLTKTDVDRQVFGGTTRYTWVEGRGGLRAKEVYLPTPEEWVLLKEVLCLDDRFDDYIRAAIPSRQHRFRADGGKALLVDTEDGDWGYQKNGQRWDGTRHITAPATQEAARWNGWGTAMKPSWEPILVGTRPR